APPPGSAAARQRVTAETVALWHVHLRHGEQPDHQRDPPLSLLRLPPGPTARVAELPRTRAAGRTPRRLSGPAPPSLGSRCRSGSFRGALAGAAAALAAPPAPAPGGARRLRGGTADGGDHLPSRCRHGAGGGTGALRHGDPLMITLPGTVTCPFPPRSRRRPSRPHPQPEGIGRPPAVPAGPVPPRARPL